MPTKNNLSSIKNRNTNILEKTHKSDQKTAKGKGGRPRKAETDLNKSTTAYLTENEKKAFQDKLKGIPEAVWLRNQILEFIK